MLIQLRRLNGIKTALLCILTTGFWLPLITASKAQKQTIYSKLAYHHLPALDSEAKEANVSPVTRKINDYNRRNMLYKLFDRLERKRKKFHEKTPILSDFTWDDLELFLGEQDRDKHLFGRINRTRTSMGDVQLQRWLVQPTDDHNVIMQRQELITSLAEDDDMLERLDGLLESIGKNENSLLSFWDKNDTRQLALRRVVEPEVDDNVQKLLDAEKTFIEKLVDPVAKIFKGKPKKNVGRKFSTNAAKLHLNAALSNIWNFKGAGLLTFMLGNLYIVKERSLEQDKLINKALTEQNKELAVSGLNIPAMFLLGQDFTTIEEKATNDDDIVLSKLVADDTAFMKQANALLKRQLDELQTAPSPMVKTFLNRRPELKEMLDALKWDDNDSLANKASQQKIKDALVSVQEKRLAKAKKDDTADSYEIERQESRLSQVKAQSLHDFIGTKVLKIKRQLSINAIEKTKQKYTARINGKDVGIDSAFENHMHLFMPCTYTNQTEPTLSSWSLSEEQKNEPRWHAAGRYLLHDLTHPLSTLKDIARYPYTLYKGYKKTSEHGKKDYLLVKGFNNAILGLYLYFLYSSFKSVNEHRIQTALVQELTRDCAMLLDDAESLFTVCQDNDELADALPRLEKTLNALNPKTSKHKALKQTRNLLGSMGVRATHFARYFTSPLGKIYASYNQLRNEKECLAPTLQLIGNIDALVSMAKYYKEMKEHKNSFCVVELDDAESPHVLLDGFWNPMIDPDVVVPSNIELGGNNPAKNAIISGPNAGGKSVSMKGITLCILFAQTFGIAPAKRMVMTPFSSINTYLNIRDDIAQGRSKFRMEALRANDLIDRIEGMEKTDEMPHGELVFSMMDETFSSTDPKEGSAAAYSIIRYLTENTHNSMTIAASHFPLLKRLEPHTNGAVKNFMIKAEVNPISYPFELYEGSSDQVIAIDLLQEEGLDIEKELRYARDILNNPNAYA